MVAATSETTNVDAAIIEVLLIIFAPYLRQIYVKIDYGMVNQTLQPLQMRP